MTLREDVAKALGPYTDGVLEQEELTDRVLSVVRDRLLSDQAVEAAASADPEFQHDPEYVLWDEDAARYRGIVAAAWAAIEGDET